MKKCYLFLLFLAPVLFGTANPVAPSCPVINELLWDENGNWKLEIYFKFFYLEPDDSLVLTSSNGTYVFPDNMELYDYYWVLTKDSTGDGFDIQKEGDFLLLKAYPSDNYYPDSSYLAFGSYSNALVTTPELGQSIALFPAIYTYYSYYTIDYSPTLGTYNDFEGSTGYISGKLYYSNGNPANRMGMAFDEIFNSYTDGYYTTRIHIGSVILNKIGCHLVPENNIIWYSIEPVSLTIEEGQTYENVDIHITDPDFVGISRQQEQKPFKIYPNPAYKKLTLEMNTLVQGQELEIRVLDVTGKEISRYLRPVAELQELELNESLPAAMYLFEFRVDNKLIQTERILVNSFK